MPAQCGGARRSQQGGAAVTGWIKAVVLVEIADAPVLLRVLEQHVSGADVTYWSEEHLFVDTGVVRPVVETADCAVQAAKGRLAGGH
jgi:hypothetical protein